MTGAAGAAPPRWRLRPRLALLALRLDVALVALVLALASAALSLHVFSIFGVVPGAELLATAVLGGLCLVPRLTWGRSSEHRLVVHTAAATASVGAALALALPLGVAAAGGRSDLAPVILLGAGLVGAAALISVVGLFDAPALPASAPWPPAQVIAWSLVERAADPWRALSLAVGLLLAQVAVPGLAAPGMSAFGLAFLGNTLGLSILAMGLVVRPSIPFFVGTDLDALSVPQGLMVGAGLAAVVQAATGSLGQVFLGRFLRTRYVAPRRAGLSTSSSPIRRVLNRAAALVLGEGAAGRRQLWAAGLALVAYLIVDLATLGFASLDSGLPLPRVLALGLLASCLTLAFQLFGGFVASRVGWLPTLGVGLGVVAISVRLGVPPVAGLLLVALVLAAGPPFAELGYQLKAGRELGHSSIARQQVVAGLLGLAVATGVVGLGSSMYFERGFIPPAAGVLALVLDLGQQSPGLSLLGPWVLVGLVVQLLGGASRQIGLLLGTGLLLHQPEAGWALLVGLATRTLLSALLRSRAETWLAIFGLGCIAGEMLHTAMGG